MEDTIAIITGSLITYDTPIKLTRQPSTEDRDWMLGADLLVDNELYLRRRSICNDANCTYGSCRNAARTDAYKLINKMLPADHYRMDTIISNKIEITSDMTTRQILEARIHNTEREMDQLTLQSDALARQIEGLRESLSDAIKEEERVAKAKADYEAKQLEITKARIIDQVNSLSPERIADLLIESGADRIGPLPISARRVLGEAYATLQASYWIRSSELKIATEFDNPWELDTTIEKSTVVKKGDKYAQVTGVCSVGALALVRAQLDDTAVQNWNQLVYADRASRLAAEALSTAILRRGETATSDIAEICSHMIINWNDSGNQQRTGILATWNAAFSEPALDLADDETGFRIAYRDVQIEAALFRTEAEAREVINEVLGGSDLSGLAAALHNWIANYHTWELDQDQFEVVPANLPKPFVAKV